MENTELSEQEFTDNEAKAKIHAALLEPIIQQIDGILLVFDIPFMWSVCADMRRDMNKAQMLSVVTGKSTAEFELFADKIKTLEVLVRLLEVRQEAVDTANKIKENKATLSDVQQFMDRIK